MVNSQNTIEYLGGSPCAPKSLSMKTLPGSYSVSGDAPLDKDSRIENIIYDLGFSKIYVQRFFDNQHSKQKLIKELIEERQQKWYNGIGNIAAASQQKEGR